VSVFGAGSSVDGHEQDAVAALQARGVHGVQRVGLRSVTVPDEASEADAVARLFDSLSEEGRAKIRSFLDWVVSEEERKEAERGAADEHVRPPGES